MLPDFLQTNLGQTIIITAWLSDEQFGKVTNTILDLLFYRNKIITQFKHSRDVYKKTYEKYKKIEPFIGQVFDGLSPAKTLSKKELKYLKDKLKDFIVKSVDYSSCLKDL
ncbi:MAG: hypothetical protein AB4038_06325 [Prochloraceae cyanobacterium]